jgi:peptide/nickel transport system permease protein
MAGSDKTSGKMPDHPVKDYRTGMPASPPSEQSEQEAARASRTLWGDAWYRLRRNKLALIAIGWLVFITIVAVTADLWVPQHFGDPRVINSSTAAANRLQGPSVQHPMGTDNLGRDVFGRVIYGARVSLVVGITAVAIGVVIGLLFGALSGFYSGWIDTIIMRLADIFLAFPYIMFAILLLSVLPESARQGLLPVTFTIGLLGWPSISRVFRSSILSVKQNDYVQAGRALGAGDMRLMFRHIAPNAIAPIVVYATMSIGGAILTEAALSFLGLGILPPSISWGRMIQDGRVFLVTNPGLVFWPGLAILSTVLAFTLLGDGVRDALDVKMKD